MSIQTTPSSHLFLHLSLFLLPFPSIRAFSSESALHIRWPKYWSFIISLCNQYSGLISFRTDWFYLTEVQGTLKSLFQCHNLKASILQHLDFFMVQLSHLHTATGKTIALTLWTFVCKVMSLLFNMLSRFVIALLPRSKHLLISWLQSLSAMILEPPCKKKIIIIFVTASTLSPSICHEVMGPDAMRFVFWVLSFKQAFSPSSRGF